MKLDLRLKVTLWLWDGCSQMRLYMTTIDDVRVAVCPECGYTEMYLEDLTKLKSCKRQLSDFRIKKTEFREGVYN